MKHFAILIWIKVRHIKKKELSFPFAENTLCLNEGRYGIPFSCMPFTNPDCFMLNDVISNTRNC